MKRSAKCFALVLAMAAVLAIPVSAGGDQANLPETLVRAVESPVQTETPLDKESIEAEEELSPTRAVACVYCDSGTMVKSKTTDTGWYHVDTIPCQCEGGLPDMQDKVMERIVVNVMTCGSCGRSDSDTSTHTKIVHYR